MTALRTLLVDDERLARTELRRLLEPHPTIEVVGEAANAAEARTAVQELDPELLFLDIQMPGGTGFDLLASLDSVPLVVFTTAWDEHALHAFEVSALDYLLKPIDPGRLARTVERVVKAAQPARGPEKTRSLTESHRIFVAEGDRCWMVRLGEVRLFESEGNYTRVYFGNEKPLINRTLNDLSPKLDDRVFFRANRGQILNVRAIRSLTAWFGGRLLADLDGGHKVTLSRRRSRDLRQQFSL
jgi:two-component system LytT family response regulator